MGLIAVLLALILLTLLFGAARVLGAMGSIVVAALIVVGLTCALIFVQSDTFLFYAARALGTALFALVLVTVGWRVKAYLDAEAVVVATDNAVDEANAAEALQKRQAIIDRVRGKDPELADTMQTSFIVRSPAFKQAANDDTSNKTLIERIRSVDPELADRMEARARGEADTIG